MNILSSVNDVCIRQLKCMLYSLAESQKEPINLFFLNSSLRDYQIDNLKKYSEALNIGFYLITIPKDLISDLMKIRGSSLDQLNRFFSVEIYNRLFAHLFLPKDISRILWIDADCIVQKDLYKFYNFNIGDTLGLAVIDGYEVDTSRKDWVREYVKKPIGLTDDDIMFNSGVLLLNLDKIREDPLFQRDSLLKFMQDHPELRYDQDILNFLCRDRICINDNQDYNFPPNWTFYDEIEADLHKKYILHYYGIHKPWLTDIPTCVLGVQPWLRCDRMSRIIDKLIGVCY